MIVRSIDVNHDWLFGRGFNDYLRNSKAVTQNIDTRLYSFLGDCFFDITAGIDWFNLLGSKNQLALELAISSVILNTEGVTSLQKLSLILDSKRKLTIKYEVTTVYTAIAGITVPVTTQFLLTEDGDFLTTESGDRIEA